METEIEACGGGKAEFQKEIIDHEPRFPLGNASYFALPTAEQLDRKSTLKTDLETYSKELATQLILVRRIGGDRREPEFQVIYRTLNRLTAEKQELNAMLEQHRSAARNNLLFSLLHGCFANEKIQSQMEDCQIPYQDSQFFTVLLFHCPETLNDQRFTLFLNIKAALIAEKAPFDLLETLDEKTRIKQTPLSVLRKSCPSSFRKNWGFPSPFPPEARSAGSSVSANPIRPPGNTTTGFASPPITLPVPAASLPCDATTLLTGNCSLSTI